MFKLTTKRDPYWLELPFGVRVKMKPFCTSTINAVQYGATRQVRKLKVEFEELKAVGKKSSSSVNFEDKDQVEDLINNMIMKGYATASIIEWENVEDPNKEGSLAECTPKNIEYLVEEPKIGQALWDHIQKDLSALFDEGNFSSPGASGTSQTGLDTAVPAKNKD